MPVKTVIVDDEQPICDEIEFLVTKHSQIEVVGKFINAIDALSYVCANGCDLVFLDIKMPGLTGLELAQRLNALGQPPLVVFITAFQEHALEAFDTPAIGYITKPITEDRIAKIMAKISNLTPKSDPKPVSEKVVVNKICVTAGNKIIPIDKNEIVFAYVKDKDAFIRTKTSEFVAALTLQEIENILVESKFIRVHRQYIVNLDKVLEIIPWFHGTYMLRMDDIKQEDVPVSRSKTKVLRTALGLK